MLNIILKGTNGCSLACSYCSLGKKEYIHMADEAMLLQIFRYVCRVCAYRNEKEVSFILHGGEPALIHVSVYENVIERIKREYPHMTFSFSMQTNGMHVDEEFLSFVKKYDIRIGVSVDGSREIHDRERRDRFGNVSFEKVRDHILTLIKHDVPVSCLMVLTSHALSEGYEYLDFFEKQSIHLKINPLLNYGEVYEHPELCLKQGEYADYLIGMYKYIAKNDMTVCISPLDKILKGVLSGGRIRECTFNPHCNHDFLCIDDKGDIYPCGRFADMGQYKIGNIDDGITDIMHMPVMQILAGRRTDRMPKSCRSCRFREMCHAGCSAQACVEGDMEGTPLTCVEYQKLFTFFHGEGLQILKNQLIREKQRENIRDAI